MYFYATKVRDTKLFERTVHAVSANGGTVNTGPGQARECYQHLGCKAKDNPVVWG